MNSQELTDVFTAHTLHHPHSKIQLRRDNGHICGIIYLDKIDVDTLVISTFNSERDRYLLYVSGVSIFFDEYEFIL